ncbi:MAG: redoxin domain-containing protein [Deltaproteobacteria bacterium]
MRRIAGFALVAVLVAAVAGLLFHKRRSGREWSWYVGHVTNRHAVEVTPSNSLVVTERYAEVMWGEHAGLRDGPYQQFWINGNKWYEGEYVLGEKDGVWKRWDQRGNLVEQRTWDHGKQVGLEVFEVDRKAYAGEPKDAVPAVGIEIPEGFKLADPSDKAKPKVDPKAPGYVPNFGLVDHTGVFRELYYYAPSKAVVLFVHGVGCPIVRHSVQEVNAIARNYAEQKVEVFMLNANLQDDSDEIEKDAKKLGIEVPILRDESQLVARSLNVTRTAEAIVIDPKTWTVAWRGPLDDRIDYEAQKSEAANPYLSRALDAMLAGQKLPESEGELRGCLVKRKETDGESIAYVEDVVPILKKHCVDCHTEGGVGPWSMEDYDDVYGWSDMIREVVATRRMPPWLVDGENSVEGTRSVSLSNAELETLVSWIDAGAKRGEGEDPLPDLQPKKVEGWPLGEPDWLVKTPPTSIPASGVLDWTYVDVEVPFDEDKWVRAVDIRPSNVEVLHHGAVLLEYPKHLESIEPAYNQALSGYFAMYLPGKAPEVYPDGAGVFMPAGSRIRFQLHYTTTGEATKDETSLAIYFYDDKPRQRMEVMSAYDFHMEVPPHAREDWEEAVYDFDQTTKLYGVFPHMHFRGKAMTFEAIYPDQRREMLITIPYYRYDWQRYYPFDEPPILPAGTRVICRGLFDNSSYNPVNPDPNAVVHFGGQSWDEMFVGWLYFAELEDDAKPVN